MNGDAVPAAQIWLASTSPRRRELLTAAGLAFACVEPGPEPEGDDPPMLEARQRAASKARGARVPAIPPEGAIVVGVDTVVDVDGVNLGKPMDAPDAARMLRALAGREHQVHTAVHLVGHGAAFAGREVGAVASARVRFAPLDDAVIAAFVAGGSWQGKAGGYGIQDAAGAFAAVVPGHGSIDTVIGLPVALLLRLLGELSGSASVGPVRRGDRR